MFKNLSLRAKILAGCCVPLILMVILGVTSFRSINSLNESTAWVDHTHEVIAEAKAVLSSAVDMETGMRGYLLAGQEDFLDPYNAGSNQFTAQVTSLKKTVNDNPDQVELLGDIETTIGEWKQNVTEPTIALRREIGDAETMNDMAKLVGEAKGKVYFDAFRQQIATFAQREEVLMAERKKAAEEATATAARSLVTVADTTKWVTHTYDVIAQAKNILASAVDMETGMRGFLLAGQDEFLDPYNNGKKEFYEDLAKLSETVSDNPAQVALLGEMKANIEEWNQKWTEPAIALRRQVGSGKTMDDVASLIAEAGGKQYFDKFRGQIATFVQREADLLGERREEGAAASKSVADSINIVSDTTKWVTHTHEVIAEAQAILASAVDMETGMRGYLLAGKDEFLDPYSTGRQQFARKVTALQQTVNDNPAQVKLLGEAKTTIDEWQTEVTEPTIALRRRIGDAKTMDDMADLVAEARGKVYFDKFREQIGTFTDREAMLMAQRQEEAAATSSNTKTTIVAGTALAIALSLFISFIVTRSILDPFKRMFAGLKTLSGGELSETTSTFLRVIDGMTENAAQVAEGSAQVSSSSQQLAAGASEQASSLEEASSSLEEMAAMTRTNAENAKQANALVNTAHKAATDGNHTMAEINEASSQISKIIKVIEEIAFQTNLLALNAAVEAARAGEHGKGFAVVADEVRNLAQRAAQAARETTSLIENSVGKAKEGANALQAIVDGVGEVTELVNGIAKASDEQSVGVDQINTAVSQMDKITQQNASGAEESASASEEMSAQAQVAQKLVNELVRLVRGTTSGQTAAPIGGATAATLKSAVPGNSASRLDNVQQSTPAAVSTGGRQANGPETGTASSSDEFLALDDQKDGDMSDF